jgi:DNA-binding MarR family transcriptional regulator
VWLRLLACTNRIENDIRARLRGEFGITLARFDLMAQLERSPGGLKMSELSKRMMVTGGNVTGLTDELEKEGLVAREDDPADRRAYTVKLTPAGRALFARMATVHEHWVIDLLAGLNGGEKSQVYRLLAKLKLHLAAVPVRTSRKSTGSGQPASNGKPVGRAAHTSSKTPAAPGSPAVTGGRGNNGKHARKARRRI